MKKASLPLIIGLIVLSGCASHYVIKLDNNSEITTSTKPKLRDQVYYFKDIKGEQQSVPRFRVRELGNRVAPGVVRRPRSSSDRRLRKLFNGQRGLPFTPTEKL